MTVPRTTTGRGRYLVVERYWCLCCGTTEQACRYQQRPEAKAQLDGKTRIHAREKCCGSCTRTAWLEVAA